MHPVHKTFFLLMVSVLLAGAATAPRITVDVKPGAAISPTMYGVFFEDINFGADGGLYAELVKNCSFEFDWPLRGWQIIRRDRAQGRILILHDAERPRNPRHIRILLEQQGDGFGLQNEGFRGMGIRQGADYRFSVAARAVEGTIGALRVELVDQAGRQIAESHLNGLTAAWRTHQCHLRAGATTAAARLNVWFTGEGVLDLDMVSLFPTATWKGRDNGLRADLVQLLADLQPGFIRFPGGCIVEGFNLSQRYQWKNSIGPVDQRVVTINRWNFEFKHRPTPDYYQSYGLGFYEYFLLAEDLGAEPMPIVNCGMACQFNTAELAPMHQLDPYIQDALDLIEFANGAADSRWGAIRAEMGHVEPFNMKMIGIGNEQWGPQYIERYVKFAEAIKEKYPEMQLIAATGSDPTIFPNGEEEVDYLWSHWRRLEPDIVDEHFYRPAEWFLGNVDWYDSYERSGPQLFVGEWAAQSVGVGSPDNRNSWKCALYEAAFMIGLERNADLVTMTCYAPLFGHEQAWQWRPDLIWFDNLSSYGSANYYVQKLFSCHRGARLLVTSVENSPQWDEKTSGLHASATLDDAQVIIKVVNATKKAIATTIDLQGQRPGALATAILLQADSLDDENSLQEPNKIYPQESSFALKDSRFTYEFSPLSLTILRVPIK